MMTTYKNTIKLFIQSISVSVPYAVLLLAENIFLFRLLRSFVLANPIEAQSIYFISDLNYLCVMGFLFFVFISYEFMRKGRSAGLDETLRERAWIIEGYQLLVLGTLVLLYAVIFMVYMGVGYFLLHMPAVCMSELWKVLSVNVVLISVTSVVMGYLVSKIRRRFAGYFVILFGLLLTVPLTVDLLLKWQIWYGIPVFTLRDLVCILPPDIDAFPDPLYGVQVEGYRIATMLAWIGLGSYLFVCRLWKNRKRKLLLSTVVLGGWLVVCGTFVMNKGSVLLMGAHPDAAAFQQAEYDAGETVQENVDFQVFSYEMDVRFGHELSAAVKTELKQETTLPRYTFTLFHGYKVSDVQDADGKSLDYVQDGDWVTIENSGQVDCSSLTFLYQGSSPTFYANRNACFLPGFFAWYPRAGKKNVYADGQFMCVDEYTSHFRIAVQGLETTSNVAANGNGFEGDSSNILLLGGTYEETEQNGVCQITYPLSGLTNLVASAVDSEEFGEEWEKLLAFYGLTGDTSLSLPDQAKKRVVIPTSTLYNGLDSFYEFDDYVMIGQSVSGNEVLKNKVRARGKEALKELFFAMNLNEDTDVNEMGFLSDEMEEAELSEEDKLHDLFVRQLKANGVQPTARAVMEYLMDENDTTSPEKFLQHLTEEDGQDGQE